MDMDIVKKKSVYVHVTFVKVGEINTLKECFEADVLIRAKWREPELDSYREKPSSNINFENYWNPKIFIENALGQPKRTSSMCVEFDTNGEAYIVERRRIQGSFQETMELWEFPFDLQDLSVCIMSDIPSTEVALQEDLGEVHRVYKRSFIDEQEWYLYKYVECHASELTKDMADPTAKRSALTVRCRSARRPSFYLFNCFSIAFLICTLSFVAFSVDPKLVQNRLQLSFTLILTSVAFKFVVNQSLPRISYLTYLDRYVLASVSIIFGTCFWHGIQKVIPDHPDKDTIALVIFGGLYLIYNIQFVLRILIVCYMARREMKQKENEYVCTLQSSLKIKEAEKGTCSYQELK